MQLCIETVYQNIQSAQNHHVEYISFMLLISLMFYGQFLSLLIAKPLYVIPSHQTKAPIETLRRRAIEDK